MLSTIVVDDHPASRTFLLHFLTKAGYAPLKAASAEEALIEAERCNIDIWLIDWMMPGMSGVDLVRRLRSGPDGGRPYLMMLTARASETDLVEAFDAGVDDFITKPISAVELQARLKAAARLVSLNNSLRTKLEEIAHLNGRLEVVASTDMLTGLLNRRAGFQRLNECWSLSERYRRPLSVSLVDIDQFKQINDQHGHDFGDAAIRHIADVLREGGRDVDYVTRIGGDEFLIIFPEVDAAGAIAAMERARRMVQERACRHDGRHVQLSISAGVAERGPETPCVLQLMKDADLSLYAAKRQGRNRVCASHVPTRDAA